MKKQGTRAKVQMSRNDVVRVLCLWANNSGHWYATFKAARAQRHADSYWLSLVYRLGIGELERSGLRKHVEKGRPSGAAESMRIVIGKRRRDSATDSGDAILSMAKRNKLASATEALAFADAVIEALYGAPKPSTHAETFAREYDGPMPLLDAVQQRFDMAPPEAASVVRAAKQTERPRRQTVATVTPMSVGNGAADDVEQENRLLRAENRRLHALNRAMRQQLVYWMPTDDLEG